MPADHETISALSEIKTLLKIQGERAEEDRRAGADAREKIDRIHTQTQTGFTEVRSDIRNITNRLDSHGDRIRSVEASAADNRISVVKVSSASAGGGGVFVLIVNAIKDWFTTGGPHN